MRDPRTNHGEEGFRPIFGQPARTFLKLTVALMLAASAAFLIALLTLVPEQTGRAFGPVGMALVGLCTWYLLLRDRVAHAVNVLAFGFWGVATVIAVFNGGMSNMAILYYPLVILVLGWMVGMRAAIIMATLSTVAVLCFALAESFGILPVAPPTPPAMRLIVQSIVYVFSAVLVIYFVRSYQTHIDKADELGRDLNRAQAVAHVGSWVYDLASDSMRLSAETCRIFGMPEGTVGNHDSYLSRVHPDDRARVDGAWQAALKGGTAFDDRHRILVGDSVRWVRQVAELEKDAEGRPLRSVGTTQDVTERKQAEDALRESESRFRDLVQNIPNVAVQGYAMDGTTRYWNSASERLYGYTAEEAVGRSLLDLIIPEEMREGVSAAIEQMASSGQPIPASELSLLRKNGTRVSVYSSHAILKAPGRAPELFCIDIDLTEQKRRETEVLATRNQLNATLNAIPDLLFEIGLDGRYYDYHSPRADLLAAPPEVLLGKTVADLLPPEAADICMSALREAHETGRSLGKQFELPLPQGRSWFEVSVSRKPVDPGQEPRFIVLSRDITDRKRNEDEYHTIIQASIDGFWITDLFGRILDVNDSVCRLLGYTRSELLGMSIRDIEADESPVEIASRTREMIQTGNARFQARHRRKDGGINEVEVSVMHVAALGKRLFAFIRNITERKRAEAARAEVESQLRESQKMEALGTLAGGVAHDFNNIVAAIIGNVELARQDVGPGHPALESLEEIRKASRRARDLVQQILAFGRRQLLERKVISLAQPIDESVRLLRSTLPAGIALRVECEPDAPPVLADATQIEQVLLNLCSNAWQAMQAGDAPGAIEVRLSNHLVERTPYRGPERRTKGERIPLRPGRYACLAVRDNGPGMNQATRSRIFEPFFTTKRAGEGTGLGLSVVHGIVHDHEASIVVQSAPGEGATFRIYFPAAQPALVQSPAPATGASGGDNALVLQGGGRHILYVDDDEAIVFLMTRLLQRQGYRVSGFVEAREALAAVRAQPDAFDLVVTDYNMPGMSGLEVAQALKEIRPGLPVALASGYITEELRAKAPAAGVRELIYKPDTAEDFSQVLARLINTLPA